MLCTDNQQEREALALFSSLHSFSLYNSSLYFAVPFPSRSHLFNLNPTPLMRYLLSSLSQSVVSLFLCERGPEHILISQLHISALPAAPSLVVQPWLSVCCSMSAYTAHAHGKPVFACASAHLDACMCGRRWCRSLQQQQQRRCSAATCWRTQEQTEAESRRTSAELWSHSG